MHLSRSNVGVTTLALTSLLASAAFALLPLQAYAEQTTVQTIQLLPPHGANCAQVSVSPITPYIYDSALHSFDFSIPDVSYIAVAGNAGDTVIPFRFMTRSTVNGALRIHVDIPTTAIPTTGLPISITLLSAQTGKPVCATIVTALVAYAAGITTLTPDNSAISYISASVGSTGTQGTSKGTKGVTAGQGSSQYDGGSMKGAIGQGTSSNIYSSGTSSGITAGGLAKFFQSFHNVCSPLNGMPVGFWLLLLVLYILIIFWAVQLETPLSFMEWGLVPVAMIFIPAILLLLFWFLVPTCRGSWIFPILVILIFILGVISAFRRHPRIIETWTRVRSSVMPS